MELILAILFVWLLIVHLDFLKALTFGILAIVGVVYAVDWIQTTSVTNLVYLFVAFTAIVVLRAINTHRV